MKEQERKSLFQIGNEKNPGLRLANGCATCTTCRHLDGFSSACKKHLIAILGEWVCGDYLKAF